MSTRSTSDASNASALQHPFADCVTQTGLFKGVHKNMMIAATLLVCVFVFFTGFNTDLAGRVFAAARGWVESTFGWYYMLVLVLLLVASLTIAVTRLGNIRLGDDDDRPEFSTFSWLSMLFSAGVGVGILFFGVAEPTLYFDTSGAFGYPNNPYADMAGATTMGFDRAADALRVTYFHWGFHGWAVYVIVGLALAYFSFRKKLPLALRSTVHPLIGNRIYGPIGHIIDILGVLGCVFGVATSLGLGVSQIAVGLDRLFGIDPGIATQVILIALISVASILSSLSGVGKGIRIISEWNIIVSALVIAYFLFGGPTAWLVQIFGASLSDYLVEFIPMGLWFPEAKGPSAWQNAWTIFYWGWWIGWAPFIGLFIARISRGRTLREFVVCVLCAPTLMIFAWLAIFGGNALHQELVADAGIGTAGIIDLVNGWDLPAALFATADGITGGGIWGWILNAMMIFLLFSWFITSSDSSTLVLTTILSMGNDNPPKRFRVFWGTMIGAVAAVLLVAGGLRALQTANMVTALPISVLVILMTISVMKSLLAESGGKSTASTPSQASS
ncbi:MULTISPECIES: BCCT family transporter [unclassified Salinivibrio]|uniref:BCCT family transporter n=1 Tax=unclassified Salinivibrio TaxID=2636825 RepID=UPI00128DD84A|nr:MULTISPECIES: BCCT family transporter [unclassified Salinivibrio]MPS31348.1 BCCT family transporter [Salinivibrio sp. VYel7]MPX92081.1 BCCT family transporter [Salinivibrio sp. VYel1]MPX92745.1 BCCT family transporter [Salinivibrio sp. VYel9]MPX95571.1 BCCT family transporter [Salinivibrio sp. VYel6]MPX98963.1 BCCT family transporter [Salinivibrio sp. VYel4]